MMKRVLFALLLTFSVAAFGAVDVNAANQGALESVKGIGPAIATKILAERKKSAFKDWADLVDRVKGLGEGNAAKLSAAGLTVSGQAYHGASSTKFPRDHSHKATAKPSADEKGGYKH